MTSRPSSSTAGYALVLTAATCWGTLGTLYKIVFTHYPLDGTALSAFRSLMAAIFLTLIVAIGRRDLLRVSRQGFGWVVAYALVGIGGFYTIYAYSIVVNGVAVAAVLLYTAPAFVALISWRCLGEKLTARMLVALVSSFAGCALVARVYDLGQLLGNPSELVWGAGAGVGYALYSVLNKVAVRHYHPISVQLYALIIGSPLLLFAVPATTLSMPLHDPGLLDWLVLIALIPTIGGGLAYTLGVQRVPVSVASIVATLEPVVATILALALFNEVMQPLQWLGGSLILLSVLILRPGSEQARALPLPEPA